MGYFTDKIVIGITGGAGSGKSTVVEAVKKEYDVEFLHCDEIAKQLMQPEGENYRLLIDKYGSGILNEDTGLIDKALLIKAVENDSKGFQGLNQTTHPTVVKEVLKQIKNSNKHIILVEAALLIESGMADYCDDIWFIYATREERIRRIKASRDWSEEKIKALINNQLSDDEFRSAATFVIENHDAEDGGKIACDRIKSLDA